MSDFLIIVLLFAIGSGIGSFLCAWMCRIYSKQNVHAPSHCEHCSQKLKWFELLPIFGWLICLGKCRHCKAPIGLEPILIEIITAGLFVVSYIFWPTAISSLVEVNLFALWLIILSGLVALAVYDLKYTKLPNKLVYPIMAVAMLFWLVSSLDGQQILQIEHWTELLLAMLPIAGVYGAIYLVSGGRLVGLGDVKLGIVAGFLLPWQGTLAVLLLANIFALIIYLCLPKKQRDKRQVPFAPALVVAIILVFLCYETCRGLLLSVYL